jgi:very-short-patch-repair endonuclease
VKPAQRRLAKQLRSTQTSLEDALWRELRAKRLDGWKWKRQVPLQSYVVDFVCFEAGLIVEADGPLHRGSEQRAYDIRRDEALRSDGFRVLRFDSDAILGDLARVIREIRGALPNFPLPALRQAGGPPSPTRGEG